ncbi:FG-GAP-like repeat-containing protein [Rosistilla oblonga]|uniref:FG-GAP-like repeat-containing protein n=1 Tax=Rosistilla oblonga TaxID=2527990 RepID=UPI003A96EA2C
MALQIRRPKGETESLVNGGLAAAQAGDFETARRLLDEALRRDPELRPALIYRGQVAHAEGELSAALAYFAAVEDTPPHLGAMARYEAGLTLLQQHEARLAESQFLRAIQLNPKEVSPRERLVELYVLQMRRDDIRQQLDAIRFLRPWTLDELNLYSLCAQRVLSPADAVAQLEPFVKQTPDDADNRFVLARYLIDAERFDEAQHHLDVLLRQEPSTSRLLGLQAESRLRQNDLEGAARALARLPDETVPEMWYWRACGRYWFEEADWQRAADCLARAEALDPEDLSVVHQLGIALGRINSDATEPTLHRAKLLDRVLRQAVRATTREPSNNELRVGILLDVADALLELKRYREAVFWFDHAHMLDSDNPIAPQGLKLAASRLKTPAPKTRSSDTPLATALAKIRPPMPHGSPSDAVPHAATAGQIQFRDMHTEAGIDFQYFNGDTGFKYLLESMGGGVAVLDFDKDGWPDLYFVQGAPLPNDPTTTKYSDKLYRNMADGTFSDVTLQAGLQEGRYGQGAAVGDFDNDGYPDLMVANYGENILYRNNGDGTFEDVTNDAGLQGSQWSSSTGFADFNNDGHLDLFVVNYVDSLRVCRGPDGKVATCNPQNFNAAQDRLYMNLGNGRFQDVTQEAGITAAEGKGLGLMIADLDGDGRLDIYVANDGTPNHLFRNLSDDKKLAFQEMGLVSGVAVNGSGQAEGGMGIACGDFHGDGQIDLFVTNYSNESNTLYANRGGMIFEDTSRKSGMSTISKPLVGFGTQAIDLDLDGQLDLFVTNGHIDDFRSRGDAWKMPSQVFRNVGQGIFEDVSTAAGAYFQKAILGRGVARLDWDRDGDSDLVVVHQDAPAALLSNTTTDQGHSLTIECVGTQSNRDAIGTRLEVETKQGTRAIQLTAGDGFYCSNERTVFIGLGDSQRVERITITWPSGRQQTLDNVASDRKIRVIEPTYGN